ncbi:MAG: hypothetical protein FWB83_07580 [Treponema sp.]|nr:hypothetical protein [Treponema sp.]
MPDLTEEEYDALDEFYTKNPPKLSGNGKSGFFAKHTEKGNTLIFVDDLCAAWLRLFSSLIIPLASPQNRSPYSFII